MNASELPQITPDNWALYFKMENDRVHSVVFDLGIGTRAPVAELPFLTRLQIPYAPSEHGFPIDIKNEDIRLDAMADALQNLVIKPASFFQRLLKSHQASNLLAYVGRVTGDGARVYHFYSKEVVGKSCFVALEKQFPGASFKASCDNDPKWSEYFAALHPGAALNPLMLSWAQLEMRKQHGDQLIEERDVDHTLVFPDKTSRDNFLDCIKNDGWKVRTSMANSDGKSDKPFPFVVDLAKRHRVDQMWSDIYLIALSSRATLSGGKYDGWGAFEVTDQKK